MPEYKFLGMKNCTKKFMGIAVIQSEVVMCNGLTIRGRDVNERCYFS